MTHEQQPGRLPLLARYQPRRGAVPAAGDLMLAPPPCTAAPPPPMLTRADWRAQSPSQPVMVPDQERHGQIRVLIIHDHALFRDGLKEILAAMKGFVVDEADDARQAISSLTDRRLDVILLQADTLDDRLTDAVCRLRNSFSNARIIVLSMDDHPEILRGVLALGVSGYLKNATRSALLAAIYASLENENHVVLSVSREALAQRTDAGPSLSPRELQVLILTGQAKSNVQIARELFVAESTVKRHLRNIFAKLDAVSRIDAVNKAIVAGLLPLSPEVDRADVSGACVDMPG